LKMNQKKSKQIASSHQKSGSGKGGAATAAYHLLPIALLVFLCLIVYYNSLSNGFVYDDFGLIVENKYINQPGRFLASLFNHSYFQMAGLEASYRPVTTLSYFLIHTVAGLDPFYYHLASLILHTFNAVLVYWLANLVLKHRLRALMAGLLFACHPALSEAVDCIGFNDDLLAAFFFLLALIFYIRIKTEQINRHIGNYSLALLFYFLGLLSKEMAITLPAIILLYDLVLRGADRGALNLKRLSNILRDRAYFYAGFVCVSLFYLCIRFFLLYSPAESQKASAGSLLDRIIYLPGHIFSFLRLTIFPGNLNADYVFSYPDSWFDISNLIGVAVVMALIGAGFFIYRYSHEIFFGIGWYLITLFPVYNLIEIYNPLAERYLYIPIIGFCLVVPVVVHGQAMRRITNPSTVTVVTLMPLIVVLSLYSTATIARNPVWKNNFALWSQTVQSSPDSLTAHGGLGMAYLERGMLDEAAEQFEISIKLYPGHAKSYYNLGLVYYQKGDQEKALEYFSRSVALNPDIMRAHYNLATIYLKQGLWDRAIRHYVKVNELDPEIPMAHYNLGMAYAMQGKLNPAIREWEAVLHLDPNNTQAQSNIQKAKKMMSRNGRQN
jgi:tetratricopeptide (TPR) repeat protein